MGRKPLAEYMQWAKVGAPWNKPGLLNCSTSGIFEMRKSYRELFGESPGDLSLTGSGDAYGHAELAAAVAFRYGVNPANVYTSQGTSMANFVTLTGIIEHGDTVLVEQPVYDPILTAALALGARVVRFVRHESADWKINIAELAALARNEHARLIVLTSPYNPGAAWTSDDDLIHLADLAGEETLILCDEVYREWGPDEAGKTIGFKRPNLIATSSLTKVWGLSRLRAGWVIAAEPLIHDISRAYDYMAATGVSPMDSISARFLADEQLVELLRRESIAHISAGRATVENWLSHDGRFDARIAPHAGFTILRCVDSEWLMSSGQASLHDWLLNEHNILTAPGRFFDLPPTHVRFAWTQGEDAVTRAIAKLAQSSIPL